MFHLDNNSGIAAMPAVSAMQDNTPRWFTEGNGSRSPSWPGQDWFNIIQAELLNVLSLAGISPEKTKLNQLALAIEAIITASALLVDNLLGEISAAGSSAQKTAQGNLGLDDTVRNAAGAMQKAANGSDILNVAAFRNALQLGTAALRNVGMGSPSNLIDMDSIRMLAGGNGYLTIPVIATTGNNLKFYFQWGNVSTPINSNNTYNVNVAFPNTILFATGNRWTNGSNAAMNVNSVGTQGIQIQNWAQSGYPENCAWIAIGY